MELKITWDEYKEFANKAIKEKYPNIIDDDTVKFTKILAYEGECDCYELPEFITFRLD